MLFGLLVSLAYLILLFMVRPHKRNDVRLMACAIQTATVLIFCMAQWIMLFNLLADVETELAVQILGFGSIDSLVATMISINFIFIIAVLLLTVYQTLTSRRVQVLRLVASHEVPELSLFDDKQYHTFLSHIWSSGQGTSTPGFEPWPLPLHPIDRRLHPLVADQTAIIKRKLQLLLPSVKVFLECVAATPHTPAAAAITVSALTLT